MLEIRSYQFTRDGRAVVATLGGRRFRVVRAYMKDGYNVAQIEWVTDVRETNEEEIQGNYYLPPLKLKIILLIYYF